MHELLFNELFSVLNKKKNPLFFVSHGSDKITLLKGIFTHCIYCILLSNLNCSWKQLSAE